MATRPEHFYRDAAATYPVPATCHAERFPRTSYQQDFEAPAAPRVTGRECLGGRKDGSQSPNAENGDTQSPPVAGQLVETNKRGLSTQATARIWKTEYMDTISRITGVLQERDMPLRQKSQGRFAFLSDVHPVQQE
ncbi:hypothetical protein CSUI_005961 [Cystoisospora suis]|uniref:Uncharacterized protein n=1 Tax=Cystoisospora suis TaxID=483139 RepID=A0A2C6KS00_9APIC|nr:hypothetical protein CSUI_005961 [Cystoisospora suis]